MKKLFISYSSDDVRKMRILEELIMNTKIFVPLIISDRRISLKSLSDKVIDGIKEADYIIPILSQNSISNQWVNQEIGYSVGKSKALRPIVSEALLNDLKGFIHKGLDIPYTYLPNNHSASENKKFKQACKKLLNDLRIENEDLKDFNLIDFFPGLWKSNYDPEIEINSDSKYYIKGRLSFSIKNFNYDLSKKLLSFVKNELKPPNRILLNNLKIEEFGEKYSGTEIENGRTLQIKYEKIN